MTSKIVSSNSPLTRVLDAVDRGHARAADRVHTVRNAVRDTLEHGLDRIEKVTHSAIVGARARLKRADSVAADGIIRAQGAIGSALEKARHARTLPDHVAS